MLRFAFLFVFCLCSSTATSRPIVDDQIIYGSTSDLELTFSGVSEGEATSTSTRLFLATRYKFKSQSVLSSSITQYFLDVDRVKVDRTYADIVYLHYHDYDYDFTSFVEYDRTPEDRRTAVGVGPRIKWINEPLKTLYTAFSLVAVDGNDSRYRLSSGFIGDWIFVALHGDVNVEPRLGDVKDYRIGSTASISTKLLKHTDIGLRFRYDRYRDDTFVAATMGIRHAFRP